MMKCTVEFMVWDPTSDTFVGEHSNIGMLKHTSLHDLLRKGVQLLVEEVLGLNDTDNTFNEQYFCDIAF